MAKSKTANCISALKNLQAANESRYLETDFYSQTFDELNVTLSTTNKDAANLHFPWGVCQVAYYGDN